MPKTLIVAGIGGSNLGTKAIQEIIGSKIPVYYADTVDSDSINAIIKNAKGKITLNVISKSGTTTETIANFEAIVDKKKCEIVVTTDKNSKLWKFAEAHKYKKLEIPHDVGGRYSVFTPVGMYPLSLMGVNVGKLSLGILKADDTEAKANAKILYDAYMNGRTINEIYFFDKSFESLGKWYRQLMAESLGKDGKGITPLISIGTTDLHSSAQLLFGGPQNKIVTIVSVKQKSKIKVPKLGYGLVDGIEGKNLDEITNAIQNGFKNALIKAKIPFIQSTIEKNEESVAKFMQEKMLEIVYLGKLLGVNPFDQPEVEKYKEETRKILTR